MDYDINMDYVIIEGDSKIIISLESKIINGNDPEKITPRWRLMGPPKQLTISFMTFIHSDQLSYST